MAKLQGFSCLFIIFLCLILVTDLVHTRNFHFKHYTFRKKHRLARKYNSMEQECEQQTCQHLSGLEQVKCTRKCVSSACYKVLYTWDELEEGEIDIRLNSFKGCVVMELQNKEL